MNDNGMTGLDPECAVYDYNELASSLMDLRGEIVSWLKDFYSDMVELWASPNATEFGKMFSGLSDELASEFCKSANIIVDNTRAAIQIMAHANNVSVNLEKVAYPKWSSDFPFRANKDGIVGMNVNLARNASNAMITRGQLLVNKIDGTFHLRLSLYDPSGNLTDLFFELIHNFSQKVSAAIETLSSYIKTSMDEETNTVLLAKTQAVNIMNG